MAGHRVILVHGLWMTGAVMSYLRYQLSRNGYDVQLFSYRTVNASLDHICAKLHEMNPDNDDAVSLIGHSLGGVLALHTLQRYPEMAVDKVICLGSPLVDSAAGRGIRDRGAGHLMLGKLLPEAVFDNPLRAWSGPQPVGVIAGTRGPGPGNLVARLPKPNDGTVAVVETHLPGIKDHVEIPVGHTRLLFSKAVANQCHYFLKYSYFLH